MYKLKTFITWKLQMLKINFEFPGKRYIQNYTIIQ